MVYSLDAAPEYDNKFDVIFDDMIENAPKRAKQFLNEYENMLGKLKIFPESGTPLNDDRLKRLSYRYKLVGDFIIYYTFYNNNIMLMQIFSQRENHKGYYLV